VTIPSPFFGVNGMPWKPEKRNYDGVQFGEFRSTFDEKYNSIHDELSDCYYNGLPFRNYGILTKEQFDKLHGLIFLKRDVDFDETNKKQPKEKQIPEERYNDASDNGEVPLTRRKSDLAKQRILELKAEGYDLDI